MARARRQPDQDACLQAKRRHVASLCSCFEVISPTDPSRRGCQLSVLFKTDIDQAFKVQRMKLLFFNRYTISGHPHSLCLCWWVGTGEARGGVRRPPSRCHALGTSASLQHIP